MKLQGSNDKGLDITIKYSFLTSQKRIPFLVKPYTALK